MVQWIKGFIGTPFIYVWICLYMVGIYGHVWIRKRDHVVRNSISDHVRFVRLMLSVWGSDLSGHRIWKISENQWNSVDRILWESQVIATVGLSVLALDKLFFPRNCNYGQLGHSCRINRWSVWVFNKCTWDGVWNSDWQPTLLNGYKWHAIYVCLKVLLLFHHTLEILYLRMLHAFSR